MSWSGVVDDRWGGRNGVVRLIVRLIGTTFFAYVLASQGVFTGPRWVAALAGLALALSYVLLVIRTLRPFDRLAVGLCVSMIIAGIVINPWTGYLGSVFFVIGGIMLVGQPEIPLRRVLALVGFLGAGLVISVLVVEARWSVVLSSFLGVVAMALFGLTRRQRLLQLQQDQALAARSAELEQRNTDLETQTERTRQEAARVAALEERSRIARDLHDVLAHSLGGLVVQLEAAGAELDGGHTTRATERIRDARRLAVDGLREARLAVQELRAPEPDDRADASVDAVEAIRAVLRGPVGIRLGAELDVVGSPRPIGSAAAATLAAVAREGLTNVNKHAPAAPVQATLAFLPYAVRLELVNGAGPAAELAQTGAGAGLTGLRERLALVGGSLTAGPEGRRWVLAAECPTGEPT